MDHGGKKRESNKNSLILKMSLEYIAYTHYSSPFVSVASVAENIKKFVLRIKLP
jgi:hypothetical protein